MRQTESDSDERQNYTTGYRQVPCFFWETFMRKIIFLSILIFKLIYADLASADTNVSESAKVFVANRNYDVDYRTKFLKSFLESHNSPFVDHADKFIMYADIYQIDWRLVPAISGVESTFGKHIPKNSYNAYGWANGNYQFKSWEESIEIVSRALREKYYDKGATNISKIARRYAPPSSTWSWKVKYFMEKIDSVPVEFDL